LLSLFCVQFGWSVFTRAGVDVDCCLTSSSYNFTRQHPHVSAENTARPSLVDPMKAVKKLFGTSKPVRSPGVPMVGVVLDESGGPPVPSLRAHAKPIRVPVERPVPEADLVPCRNACGWSSFGNHTTCCASCCSPQGPHANDCAAKNVPAPVPVIEKPVAVKPAECSNRCGWTAFPGRETCCTSCRGVAGPHKKDCAVKNQSIVPRCARGCGRPAFGNFATCCTRCTGNDGPHAKDCAEKCGLVKGTTTRGSNLTNAAPQTRDELVEDLRSQLADWDQAGSMRSSGDVNEVVSDLAESVGVDTKEVKMLWHSVARQVRPKGGGSSIYVDLAWKHHQKRVEVVDLGQFSTERANSCMFLTCAVSLADRRLKGFADAELPGILGAVMTAECVRERGEDVNYYIEEHRRNRCSMLGTMADALRLVVCELLATDRDEFQPYFFPVHGSLAEKAPAKAYDEWVANLRRSEEGDELVMLGLAQLCGIAIQPVQQSGYRVPLMDPTEASASGVLYWGNDDKHWVWLRPLA